MDNDKLQKLLVEYIKVSQPISFTEKMQKEAIDFYITCLIDSQKSDEIGKPYAGSILFTKTKDNIKLVKEEYSKELKRLKNIRQISEEDIFKAITRDN